jgi:hypothetical protein
MTISAIRIKLQEYIKVADEKKIKAIFALLEDDIIKDFNWWEDKNLVKDFENRIKECKNGTNKAFSLEEIDVDIEKIKANTIS